MCWAERGIWLKGWKIRPLMSPSVSIYVIFIHGINYFQHISLNMATIFRKQFFTSKTVICAVFHKIRVRIIAQKDLIRCRRPAFSSSLVRCATHEKSTLYIVETLLLPSRCYSFIFPWSLQFSAVLVLLIYLLVPIHYSICFILHYHSISISYILWRILFSLLILIYLLILFMSCVCLANYGASEAVYPCVVVEEIHE